MNSNLQSAGVNLNAQLPLPVQTQLPTNQIVGVHNTTQMATNQIAVVANTNTAHIPLPVHQTTPPIVPSTLNVMPAHLQHQEQMTGILGGAGSGVHPTPNPNLIQSPLSPLTTTSGLYGQNPLVQNPIIPPNILQQQTGSPLISPSTPSIGSNNPLTPTLPLAQQYAGIQSQIGYQNTTPATQNATYLQNSDDISLLAQQQQLQLLKQQHQQLLQQQQMYQQMNAQNIQQQQQLLNQTIPNINAQTFPQGGYPHQIQGALTNIHSPNNNIITNGMAQMAVTSSPMVSTEFNPNVNTLPHTLPTTLNPSLKKKFARNVVLNSSGSMSPLSPKNGGPLQDSWGDVYEDANTSGIGSSVCSPMSPGAGWSEYVIPCYETPAEKDQCLRCRQKVYAMEKVGPVRDVLYHKNCFTCVACGSKLSLKNFHHNPNDSDDYNVFCTSHKPRVVNLASEGNAFYLAKQSPRTPKIADQMFDMVGQETNNAHPTRSESNVPTPEKPKERVNDPYPDQSATASTTNDPAPNPPPTLEGDITKVVLRSQNNTSSGSRKSVPSNSGSSPFSSVSSSSSYATSLKTEGNEEFDIKNKDGREIEIDDFPTNYNIRSDRPSSMSSISTTSSTGTGRDRDRKSSIEQQETETSSITSNTSSLERPDRPSSFQRSVSTIDPPHHKLLSDVKKSSKMLVKSHSSQEFSINDLKAVVEPRRLLTRNESMRMDRPSQYH